MKNEISKLFIFCIYILLAIFFHKIAEGKENSHEVSISSRITKKLILEFTIENIGNRDIDFYQSRLPWGVVASTDLAALIDSRDMGKIELFYYPDDPGVQIKRLKINEKISGEIDLTERFKNINTIFCKNNIFLVIRHDLFDIDNKKLSSYRKMHYITNK
ncbi:hypothetical protein [Delftia acidovorans]|uniref:hypothetical protein n=1 Tax=Delftia acidovorans TaxID=80866 RepID=UPI0024200B01|nr:hypothetical protein [Delftia acidovorans]